MSMNIQQNPQERSTARNLLPLVAIVFSGFLCIGSAAGLAAACERHAGL